MAIGTRLGPNGLPIDEGFFGNQGLGGALASLPGTPVLNQNPFGPPLDMSGGTNVSNTPAPGSGQGIGTTTGGGGPPKTETPYSGYENPSAQGPLAGSTPQTNPGTPPPNAPAGTSNFFGDTSPWAQNVGASINDQPVSFASPGNPNPNYITPDAAGRIGQAFGANVVEQNRTNMSSPGSSAPSAPLYGLDFQHGDIQGADVAATGLARGDSPESIAARYQAGLRNSGWGGPAPAVSRADENGMWNYSTPISTNNPTAAQSSFFGPGADAGAAQYQRNLAGEGNYGQSSGSGADQAALIQWLRSQLGQA